MNPMYPTATNPAITTALLAATIVFAIGLALLVAALLVAARRGGQRGRWAATLGGGALVAFCLGLGLLYLVTLIVS